MSEDEFFTRKAAALYLKKLGCPISPVTLGNMSRPKYRVKGPPYIRTLTRIVRYRRRDLDAWAAANSVRVE
jgi:hypothetical protein